MKTLALVSAVALASLSGCALDEGGLVPDGASSLHDRLGGRAALSLTADSALGIVARDGQGRPIESLAPEVLGGEVTLRSTETGLLLIESLHVDLGDVVIPEGVIYGPDIELTRLQLTLDGPLVLEPSWAESEALALGDGEADLLFDYALRTDDDEVLPLATQRLRAVTFEVAVALDHRGELSANLSTQVEGRISGFADRLTLSDLTLAVRAAE